MKKVFIHVFAEEERGLDLFMGFPTKHYVLAMPAHRIYPPELMNEHFNRSYVFILTKPAKLANLLDKQSLRGGMNIPNNLDPSSIAGAVIDPMTGRYSALQIDIAKSLRIPPSAVASCRPRIYQSSYLDILDVIESRAKTPRRGRPDSPGWRS